MDQTLKLQLSGKMTATAWQPTYASHRHGKGILRNFPSSSEVRGGCYGGKNGQRGIGFSFRNSPHGIQGSQRRKVNGKIMTCSVVNQVVPPESFPSPDDLKNKLEALQDEALEVRNRCNNARARFMRLTEVAQQLRQRASIDLNFGNEDGARRALMDKQKVIQAAELSKKRLQLLEELSSKLGDAISIKQEQLMVALLSPKPEEPTVRVVFPKEDRWISEEKNPPVNSGTVERPSQAHEMSPVSEDVDKFQNSATASEDVRKDEGQLANPKLSSLDVEATRSAELHLHSNEEGVGDRSDKSHEPNNTDSPLGEMELRDFDVQSGESPVVEDSLHSVVVASDINTSPAKDSLSDTEIATRISNVDHANNSESAFRVSEFSDLTDSREVGNPSPDTALETFLDVEGLLGQKNSSRRDGPSFSVEDLRVDVDHQFAAIQSRLRSAVGSDVDPINYSKLHQLGDLLEQLQNLRERISDVLTSLATREGQ